MSGDFASILSGRLEEARAQQRGRRLAIRCGADFSSNDYLGFSEDECLRDRAIDRLRDLPLGATGSRLLRGNLELHEEVEESLAGFCGTEAALVFPSGYQANLGLLSALLREGDQVFSDEANHASLIDGLRLSRARKVIFPHNDTRALRQLISTGATGRGNIFIVTESLFSMEGDFAPLDELAEIARETGAFLIVDESHATGVYGGGCVQVRGLRSPGLASVHTGGKALGVGGAWVAGSSLLREYLIQFCRPWIYSTAISPGLASTLAVAVDYWSEVGAARAIRIRERASRMFQRLQDEAEVLSAFGVSIPQTASPILPLIVGSNSRALELSQELRDKGFDVRAIRPPAVPEGAARIRITVNWNSSEEDQENLFGALLGFFNAHGGSR